MPHRSVWVVLTIGLALGVLGGGCGESPSDKVKSDDQVKRISALRDLGKADNDEAARQIAQAVPHQDLATACEAVRAAGRMSASRSAPILRRAAQDSRPEIRQEAVIQLEQVADPNSPEVLRQLVKSDPDARVRVRAAIGLGRKGVGQVSDAYLLADVAEQDEDAAVRTSAVASAEQLIGLIIHYDDKASPEERQKAIRRLRYWTGRTEILLRLLEQQKEGKP